MGKAHRGDESLLRRQTLAVFFKKMLFMVIGMLIQSSGVYLLIRSRLGLAPVALLNQGLSVAFHVSYGGGALISGLSCLFIVLCWCRKYVNIGTFIITFSFGILVDAVSAGPVSYTPLPVFKYSTSLAGSL